MCGEHPANPHLKIGMWGTPGFMATIVIGGQASGVGKTGLICALIQAMPERRWTAIKITQCSHQNSETACDCELHGQAVAITGQISSGHPPAGVTTYRQEHIRMARTDSYRYLAAGAMRSWWVRTLPGHLGKAMPRLEEEIARGDVLIESNSVMEFLRPDIYAVIMSPDIADFKPTARRYLDRADAILTVGSDAFKSRWPEAVERRMSQVPRFSIGPARHVSPGFFAFVRRRLNGER